jgi:hypothetical protein
MGVFFQELSKQLAGKWMTLLALPGALFTALLWLAASLRHGNALSTAAAAADVTRLATAMAHLPGTTQALLAALFLLVSSAVALIVRSGSGLVSRLWLGQWPRPLSRLSAALVRRRTRTAAILDERVVQLERDHPQETRTPEQSQFINDAAAARNRVVMASTPARPTWMGDRMHAVERIARDRRGLDVPFAWPRLWLVLPESVRSELDAANSAYTAATITGAWGVVTVLVGILWWPAVILGLVVLGTGWARARLAVDGLSTLAEAAIDLHGRTLAHALGVGDAAASGVLEEEEGESINDILRKGR